MDSRLFLGIAGSITLAVGVFAPIVSAPVVGDVNYFRNGQGDGTIVLILAVFSLILTLTRRYEWLWLTGVATLSVLGFTFVVIIYLTQGI